MTRFWVSKQVVKAIAKRDGKERAKLLKRLLRYAENGFWNYQGDDLPIRHEWAGVFRIGHDDDLFRIIGFYEDQNQVDFIAIDAFLKKGQDLTPAQRKRIDEVVRVKDEHDWQKEA